MRILFETSNFCNSKCVFCPQSAMKRQKGEMSDEIFEKIIQGGKAIGVKDFYPFLNGEPFMFSKIYEWLDYLEKEKVSVYLYTNAVLMDVDRLVKYSCIRLVNCSLNAVKKRTYKKLMPGSNFKKAVKNTKDLIKKAPFRVSVSMLELPENKKEKEKFKKIWGKRAKFSVYKNWAGEKGKILPGQKRIPCYYLMNNLTVLWDGRVALCCMDNEGQVILGDVNKDSLIEIWTRSAHLRQRHKNLDFAMPLCENCNVNLG